MKKSKVLSAIMLVITLFLVLNNFVLAADPGSVWGDTMANDTDYNTAAYGKVKSIGNKIYSVISITATAVCVIVIIVLGLKYMMGSAEEKAEYKKTLLPYFIGAVFVLSATGIVNLLYNMFKGYTFFPDI